MFERKEMECNPVDLVQGLLLIIRKDVVKIKKGFDEPNYYTTNIFFSFKIKDGTQFIFLFQEFAPEPCVEIYISGSKDWQYSDCHYSKASQDEIRIIKDLLESETESVVSDAKKFLEGYVL